MTASPAANVNKKHGLVAAHGEPRHLLMQLPCVHHVDQFVSWPVALYLEGSAAL